MNRSWHTLVTLLRERAQLQGEACAYTFLDYGRSTRESITYAQLDERARALASVLQDSGAPGQRVVLLFHSGLEYLCAFFACLYAGKVAVPVYPPSQSRHMARVSAVVADADPACIMSTTSVATTIRNMSLEHRVSECRWILTDAVDNARADDWRDADVQPSQIAFLQYTSGSTGRPKGVMVTHENILANEQIIHTAFGIHRESVVVGWLPLYHDMGLIGNILQSLYSGIPCVFMSPLDFLQRPLRWLQAITEFAGTISGGPNFSYELCVSKIRAEALESLDLRSWTLAFNGSEPIRSRTMQRFAEAFSPCGFASGSFYPCYGLAESTLYVTGGRWSVGLSDAALDTREDAGLNEEKWPSIVNCGQAGVDHDILIVDPTTCVVLPAMTVGEIWVAGASLTVGYWDDPDATSRAFHGHIEGVPDKHYLRTGDLGYLSPNADIYVTGRLKDIILIRGRNLYPQDLEWIVEQSHPAIHAGSTAAFGIQDEDGESLVILAELDRHHRPRASSNVVSGDAQGGAQYLNSIIGAVKAGIAREFAVSVRDVVLLKTGSIPKTSSGKIRHTECRKLYLEDQLDSWGYRR